MIEAVLEEEEELAQQLVERRKRQLQKKRAMFLDSTEGIPPTMMSAGARVKPGLPPPRVQICPKGPGKPSGAKPATPSKRAPSRRPPSRAAKSNAKKSASAAPSKPTVAPKDSARAEVIAELVEGDTSACVEADLNLARVQLGSVIGTTAEDDAVPEGARRAAGVSVRLTRMYYGVASDGAITAPRVRRFIKQMSFERRARSLEHGSLVCGEGTWSVSGQPAPIVLPSLPSTIEALAELFVQFPTTDVQKFVAGGPDATIKLAVGEEMAVPGLFALKNIGGTIVATRTTAV